jgi:hypothetical protein
MTSDGDFQKRARETGGSASSEDGGSGCGPPGTFLKPASLVLINGDGELSGYFGSVVKHNVNDDAYKIQVHQNRRWSSASTFCVVPSGSLTPVSFEECMTMQRYNLVTLAPFEHETVIWGRRERRIARKPERISPRFLASIGRAPQARPRVRIHVSG